MESRHQSLLFAIKIAAKASCSVQIGKVWPPFSLGLSLGKTVSILADTFAGAHASLMQKDDAVANTTARPSQLLPECQHKD